MRRAAESRSRGTARSIESGPRKKSSRAGGRVGMRGISRTHSPWIVPFALGLRRDDLGTYADTLPTSESPRASAHPTFEDATIEGLLPPEIPRLPAPLPLGMTGARSFAAAEQSLRVPRLRMNACIASRARQQNVGARIVQMVIPSGRQGGHARDLTNSQPFDCGRTCPLRDRDYSRGILGW